MPKPPSKKCCACFGSDVTSDVSDDDAYGFPKDGDSPGGQVSLGNNNRKGKKGGKEDDGFDEERFV